MSRLHPTFQEPDIQIEDDVLQSWEHDQLEDAEVSLTVAIDRSRNPCHHALASRALVRARLVRARPVRARLLSDGDAAIADATEVCLLLRSPACGH